jgi:hypothetical protein
VPASTPASVRLSKRFLRNARWRGTRLLPYMDDFLFLVDSYNAALLLRQRVEALLEQLGLQRNPKKDVERKPHAIRRPLGLNGRPSPRYVSRPAIQAPPTGTTRVLPSRPSCFKRPMATRTPTRSVRRESLVPLPRHRALSFLFVRNARRPCNSHWPGGGRVRLTHQLRRDLEWWRAVPTQNNGRSIYKPVETAYLHANSLDYGWEPS